MAPSCAVLTADTLELKAGGAVVVGAGATMVVVGVVLVAVSPLFAGCFVTVPAVAPSTPELQPDTSRATRSGSHLRMGRCLRCPQGSTGPNSMTRSFCKRSPAEAFPCGPRSQLTHSSVSKGERTATCGDLRGP